MKDVAHLLWFAQNSLPLRWQRQQTTENTKEHKSCDLLKIHYLCGDKDNETDGTALSGRVVICSKFITFAVTKTTCALWQENGACCDLLKIHYLCGDKDNGKPLGEPYRAVVICSKFITFAVTKTTLEPLRMNADPLWFAQNSLPLRWQRQPSERKLDKLLRCDLLKIHYLCGDKDNFLACHDRAFRVVICSKFITFAVTKTTLLVHLSHQHQLWFAQNSLPLRWQRQLEGTPINEKGGCDLLKIHYLCGDKDNVYPFPRVGGVVVICSKFITFAVTKTTGAIS